LPWIFCTYGTGFSLGISIIDELKKSFKEGPFLIFLIGFLSTIARSVVSALIADTCEGIGIVP